MTTVSSACRAHRSYETSRSYQSAVPDNLEDSSSSEVAAASCPCVDHSGAGIARALRIAFSAK